VVRKHAAEKIVLLREKKDWVAGVSCYKFKQDKQRNIRLDYHLMVTKGTQPVHAMAQLLQVSDPRALLQSAS